MKFAPVRHRLVRTHPATGRKSLFLSSHIGGIVGWPVPEAMAFVRDLAEHATQRQFVYAHAWRQYDLVMWDNRADHASGATLQGDQRGARHAPHHARGRRTDHPADGGGVAEGVPADSGKRVENGTAIWRRVVRFSGAKSELVRRTPAPDHSSAPPRKARS